MRTIGPPTCGCTATVCSGSTVPVAASSKGTSRRSAVPTVTGTRCWGGADCSLQAARRTREASQYRVIEGSSWCLE